MSRTRTPQRPKQRRKYSRASQFENPRCPTPGKLAFSSQSSAESALKYNHHDGRSVKPQRVYQCACGDWHWTSRSDWDAESED